MLKYLPNVKMLSTMPPKKQKKRHMKRIGINIIKDISLNSRGDIRLLIDRSAIAKWLFKETDFTINGKILNKMSLDPDDYFPKGTVRRRAS